MNATKFFMDNWQKTQSGEKEKYVILIVMDVWCHVLSFLGANRMHSHEKISSFHDQRMGGLVFDKKISWQTEYLFASHPLFEFRISPFLRGDGEKKDFYVKYYFLGFFSHNIFRDAYGWYFMIRSI